MKLILKTLPLSLLIIVLNLSAQSQTSITAGDVSGTWTKSGSPYLVEGDIIIPTTQSLTIEPGVKVEFQGPYSFDVQGTLLALGTIADTILFTINDTTGFHNQADTGGGWSGISMYDTPLENDTTRLAFCRLEFAKAYGELWYQCVGGALFVMNYNKVVVSDCLFTFCSAGGPDIGVGGAIGLEWADIQIRNTSFRDNLADFGGAVHLFNSSPSFSNNLFESNTAFIDGGAIDMKVSSRPVFKKDQFLNNRASGNGGVFRIDEQAAAQFTNVSFSGNSSEYGGALNAWNCELTFTDCSFENNTCNGIGGVFNFGNGKLTLTGCEFANNSAVIFGGVMGSYDSEIDIDGCTMSDNVAGILGGAIHSDWSQLTINNSLFERDSSGETGGALWLWHCDAYFDDCEFNDNRAQYNGAAIGSDSSDIHIENSQFLSNKAVWGGAVLHNRGALHITDCTFSENYADHGAAIKGGWTDFYLTNVAFEDNKGVWGGAIDAFNSNLLVDYCAFARNEALDLAGAIQYIADTSDLIDPVSLIIRGTEFRGNIAGNRGGAAMISQLNSSSIISSMEISDCRFENNNASARGAMQIDGGIRDIRILNSIFDDNISNSNTSIFGIMNGSTGEVVNCVFSNNQPRAGLVHGESDIAFTNCTFAYTSGAAMDVRRGGIATMTNSIFWGNGRTANVLSAAGLPSYFHLNYCDVEFGLDSIFPDSTSLVSWGLGNLTTDPKFVDKENNDFHLHWSSPCLEAGIRSIQVGGRLINAPDTDLEGNPRPAPSGTNPDFGAYESPVPAGISDDMFYIQNNFLLQNTPNPFANQTVIGWYQADFEQLQLDILDVFGKHIITLIDKQLPSGIHRMEFDARDLPAGIYLYRLTSKTGVETKRMQIIK